MVKLEGNLNYSGNDWFVLKRYLTDKIEETSKRLRNKDTNWDETQLLRGSILALQTILDTETYNRENGSN